VREVRVRVSGKNTSACQRSRVREVRVRVREREVRETDC
jgi:hypothetical protein